MMIAPMIRAAILFGIAQAVVSGIAQSLQPISILYQPINQQPSSSSRGKSSTLASIKYNPTTLESQVITYTPPKASSGNDVAADPLPPLYRISLDSPHSSSSVTSLATFNPEHAQTLTLTLRLNDEQQIFAVSVSVSTGTPPPTLNSSTKPNNNNNNNNNNKPRVVILPPTPGPTPILNVRKPVALDAEGKEVPEVPEVEKSLIQRYWWVFALVAVLALTGGGDK